MESLEAAMDYLRHSLVAQGTEVRVIAARDPSSLVVRCNALPELDFAVSLREFVKDRFGYDVRFEVPQSPAPRIGVSPLATRKRVIRKRAKE
jgi:hypothetical protein